MANFDGRTVLTGPGGRRLNPFQVIFPFTPVVQYSADVAYTSYNLTHTNYTVHAYQGTPSPQIQVTGQFTTHTKEEHTYVRDVIHFFRTVTKMHYGIKDPLRGTPPPICRFYSHGKYMFENVPVLVQSFQAPLDNSVDQITHDGTSLPAIMTISCNLLVHINPAKQKKQFSLQGFANGDLYKDGFI